MRYLIDGYNLIAHITSISLSDTNKEEALTQWLKKRLEGKKDSAIIVFDGHGALNEFGSKEAHGTVTIVFTPVGETADDMIIRRCEALPQKSAVTVVSSDKAIWRSVRPMKVAVIQSESFIREYRIKQDHSKPDYALNEQQLSQWLDAFGG